MTLVDDQTVLATRWAVAHEHLDLAHRHVEIGVVTLLNTVVEPKAEIVEAIVMRWVRDALAELAHLDFIGELPRGVR